mmetsp:Transcript_41654/g.114936  ORF Transcript_41654/g.114936 Transcript_41654/m.114936 type:complete len:204 (-) Transcript_41654:75-686(-)
MPRSSHRTLAAVPANRRGSRPARRIESRVRRFADRALQVSGRCRGPRAEQFASHARPITLLYKHRARRLLREQHRFGPQGKAPHAPSARRGAQPMRNPCRNELAARPAGCATLGEAGGPLRRTRPGSSGNARSVPARAPRIHGRRRAGMADRRRRRGPRRRPCRRGIVRCPTRYLGPRYFRRLGPSHRRPASRLRKAGRCSWS